MSAHDAETRPPSERPRFDFPSYCLRSSRLTCSERNRRGAGSGYSVGFRLASCSATPSSCEASWLPSLLPLACDFRRLRFSRNASFSRSSLASFPGLFAGVLVCAPRLSLSSFIVALFEYAVCKTAAMRRYRPTGEVHALAALPQRTLDGWHRLVASGDHALPGSLLSEHIVFRSAFVQPPSRETGILLVLTTVVRIFESFRYHQGFYRRFSRRCAGIFRQYRQMADQRHRSHQIQRVGRNDRIRGHDPPDRGAGRVGRGNREPDRPAIEPAEGGRGSRP